MNELKLRQALVAAMRLGGAGIADATRALTQAIYDFGTLLVDCIPADVDLGSIVTRIEAEVARVSSSGILDLGEGKSGELRTARFSLAEEPAAEVVSTIKVGELLLPCDLDRNQVTQGGHIEVIELHALCVALGCSVILFTEEGILGRPDNVRETVQVFIRDADGVVEEGIWSPDMILERGWKQGAHYFTSFMVEDRRGWDTSTYFWDLKRNWTSSTRLRGSST